MSSPPKSAAAEETITIVIADDHHVVRSGLGLLLEGEDGFAVVAEAADADSALRCVLGHKPTILVLDLNMPGDITGLGAIPHVNERSPRTAVVVLTMQEDPSFARAALQAGARGYVLKDSAEAELIEAVRRVAAGETYLAPRLGAALATLSTMPKGPPDDLTQREVGVLGCSPSGTRTLRSARSFTSRSARLNRTELTSSRSFSARPGPSWSDTPSTATSSTIEPCRHWPARAIAWRH